MFRRRDEGVASPRWLRGSAPAAFPSFQNTPAAILSYFMSRFATLLLDLDGTLVDAFTTIHRSYTHVLPEFGRPAPTSAQVRRAVGGGLENAMRHFLPEELIAEGVRRHIAHTDSILLEDVKLMPGAMELLRDQHATGTALAAFTNKRGDHSRLICQHLGVTPFLRGIFRRQ